MQHAFFCVCSSVIAQPLPTQQMLPSLASRYLAGNDILALCASVDFPPCMMLRRLLEGLLMVSKQVRRLQEVQVFNSLNNLNTGHRGYPEGSGNSGEGRQGSRAP